MSLQFLFPYWLWALFLIVIPIVVHLFNFRRYKLVYFTNVHLLKEVKKDSHAKTQLKELLILLSRILFILFLVLAFAQPVLIDKSKKRTSAKASDLVIIVDNSFSMSSNGERGLLIEEAKQKILELVSAYPASTQTMLISTDVHANQLIFKTKEDVYSAVSQLNISPFSSSISKAFKLAKNRLSPDLQHHVYIVSDFQKAEEELSFENDSNINLTFVPLEIIESKNLSIDTAFFYSPVHNIYENESLIYKLTNSSDQDIVDYPVELYIDDSLKTISNVEILARNSVIDTFYYKNSSSGMSRGRISLSDFPIVYDNDLYFNYLIKERLKVGIFSNASSNLFLDAFFKNNTYYRAQYFDIKKSDLSRMNDNDIIIIDYNNSVSDGFVEQVKSQLKQKKPLIVFLNQEQDYGELDRFLAVNEVDVDTAQKVIKYINSSSNLYRNAFDKFDSKLEPIPVKKAFEINNINEWLVKSASGEVLVGVKNVMETDVLLFSIPCIEANDNFYTHSVFLPLMYNYMSNTQTQDIYFQAGANNTLFLNRAKLNQDEVFEIQQENNSWIPEQYTVNTGVKIHLPEKLEASYYSISNRTDKSSEGFSINYNREEALAEYFSKEELLQFNNGNVEIFESSKNSIQSIEQRIKNSTSLWYYFILVSIVFICLEILLIRFWRQ